jgi:hypothetical protein
VLGSYNLVVDTEPDVDDKDLTVRSPLASGSRAVLSTQCASCNFLDFLAQVDDLGAYDGLVSIRGFFAALPEVALAAASGDGDALLRVAARFGASAVYEVSGRAVDARTTGLPRICRVRDDDAPAQLRDAARAAKGAGWVLVEPSACGPSRLLAALGDLARAGAERVLFGYVSHAAAIDGWSAFVESDDFRDRWYGLLLRARELGLAHLGLAIALPPCATLQMRRNLPLEERRARLDTQFRRMDADYSLMCPENVSGYSLTNDTRAVLAGTRIARRGFAIRHSQVVFAF